MKKRRTLGVLAALFMILGLGAVASAATTGPDIGGRSQWFFGQTIDFGSSEVKYKSYSSNDLVLDRDASIKMFAVAGSRRLQAGGADREALEYRGNSYRVFDFHEIDSNRGQELVVLQDSSDEGKTPTGIRVVEGDGSPSAPYMFECIYEAPPAHVHSFSTGWTSDGACHWHACTAEGAGGACLNDAGAQKAEHSYGASGDARFTCAVCQYVDSAKRAKAEEADKAARDAKEKEAADKKAADAVIEKIKAIGAVSYTAECKSRIDAARTAYDALGSDPKKLVTNYSTLTDAEKKYADLKAEAEKAEAEKEETQPSGGTPAPKTTEEQPQTQQEKITVMKAPSSVKAKANKNKVTVSWKKIKKNKAGKKLLKQIRRIEVQAAMDPEFKNIAATKKVGKKKSKTVLKLARKTMYYIRVRYVGINGVSKWSKTRKIKTK